MNVLYYPSLRAVHDDFLQRFDFGGVKILAAFEEAGDSGVSVVIGHDLDQFWEMVGIPLSHAHRERVDVLVQLVQQSDCLNDHVVDSVDVELDFGPGVRVAETELRLGFGRRRQASHKVGEVKTNPAKDLFNLTKL